MCKRRQEIDAMQASSKKRPLMRMPSEPGLSSAEDMSSNIYPFTALQDLVRPARAWIDQDLSTQVFQHTQLMLSDWEHYNDLQKITIVADVDKTIQEVHRQRSVGTVFEEDSFVPVKHLKALLKRAKATHFYIISRSIAQLASAIEPHIHTNRDILETERAQVVGFLNSIREVAVDIGLVNVWKDALSRVITSNIGSGGRIMPRQTRKLQHSLATQHGVVRRIARENDIVDGQQGFNLPDLSLYCPQADRHRILQTITTYYKSWCQTGMACAPHFLLMHVRLISEKISMVLQIRPGEPSTAESKQIEENYRFWCNKFKQHWTAAAEDHFITRFEDLKISVRRPTTMLTADSFISLATDLEAMLVATRIANLDHLSSHFIPELISYDAVNIGKKRYEEIFAEFQHKTYSQYEVQYLWLMIWRSLKLCYHARQSSNDSFSMSAMPVEYSFLSSRNTLAEFKEVICSIEAAKFSQIEELVGKYCHYFARCRNSSQQRFRAVQHLSTEPLDDIAKDGFAAFLSSQMLSTENISFLHQAVLRLNEIFNGPVILRRAASSEQDERTWIPVNIPTCEELGLDGDSFFSNDDTVHPEVHIDEEPPVVVVPASTTTDWLTEPEGHNVKSAFDYVHYPFAETRANEVMQSEQISRELRQPGIVSEGPNMQYLQNRPPTYARIQDTSPYSRFKSFGPIGLAKAILRTIVGSSRLATVPQRRIPLHYRKTKVNQHIFDRLKPNKRSNRIFKVREVYPIPKLRGGALTHPDTTASEGNDLPFESNDIVSRRHEIEAFRSQVGFGAGPGSADEEILSRYLRPANYNVGVAVTSYRRAVQQRHAQNFMRSNAQSPTRRPIRVMNPNQEAQTFRYWERHTRPLAVSNPRLTQRFVPSQSTTSIAENHPLAGFVQDDTSIYDDPFAAVTDRRNPPPSANPTDIFTLPAPPVFQKLSQQRLTDSTDLQTQTRQVRRLSFQVVPRETTPVYGSSGSDELNNANLQNRAIQTSQKRLQALQPANAAGGNENQGPEKQSAEPAASAVENETQQPRNSQIRSPAPVEVYRDPQDRTPPPGQGPAHPSPVNNSNTENQLPQDVIGPRCHPCPLFPGQYHHICGSMCHGLIATRPAPGLERAPPLRGVDPPPGHGHGNESRRDRDPPADHHGNQEPEHNDSGHSTITDPDLDENNDVNDEIAQTQTRLFSRNLRENANGPQFTRTEWIRALQGLRGDLVMIFEWSQNRRNRRANHVHMMIWQILRRTRRIVMESGIPIPSGVNDPLPLCRYYQRPDRLGNDWRDSIDQAVNLSANIMTTLTSNLNYDLNNIARDHVRDLEDIAEITQYIRRTFYPGDTRQPRPIRGGLPDHDPESPNYADEVSPSPPWGRRHPHRGPFVADTTVPPAGNQEHQNRRDEAVRAGLGISFGANDSQQSQSYTQSQTVAESRLRRAPILHTPERQTSRPTFDFLAESPRYSPSYSPLTPNNKEDNGQEGPGVLRPDQNVVKVEVGEEEQEVEEEAGGEKGEHADNDDDTAATNVRRPPLPTRTDYQLMFRDELEDELLHRDIPVESRFVASQMIDLLMQADREGRTGRGYRHCYRVRTNNPGLMRRPRGWRSQGQSQSQG